MANYDDDTKIIFKLIIGGVLIWMLFGGVLRCMGIKGGDMLNSPIEYRHSDRIY